MSFEDSLPAESDRFGVDLQSIRWDRRDEGVSGLPGAPEAQMNTVKFTVRGSTRSAACLWCAVGPRSAAALDPDRFGVAPRAAWSERAVGAEDRTGRA